MKSTHLHSLAHGDLNNNDYAVSFTENLLSAQHFLSRGGFGRINLPSLFYTLVVA